MKNTLVKNYSTIFIVLQCLLFLLLIVTMFSCIICDPDDKVKITLFTAFIANIFGYIKFSTEDSKIKKDIFDKFNEKYDLKFNDLFNLINELEKENIDTIEALENHDKFKTVFEKKINVRLLVIDYINMCSEQYLWYEKGRVDEDIWIAWFDGIKYNLSLPILKDIVEKELEENETSHYGFAQYYNKLKNK